ncbi:MAG: PDZ domain-containing protein [Planctomycetaceae bacterium]|nr:PDZ domain-containing protein [Planctomycetaceae bacterium]
MKRTLLAAVAAIGLDSVELWAQAPAEPLQPSAFNAQPTPTNSQQGKPHLGVSINEVYNTGLVVGAVESGGPAEVAGLRAADVIKTANDQIVRTNLELGRIVSSLAPGSPLRLVVSRVGVNDQTISITPTQRTGISLASSTTPSTLNVATMRNRGLGVTVAPVTPYNQQPLQVPNLSGAHVTGMWANSPAHRSGIPANAVIVEFNGRAVTSPAELTSAVAVTEPTRAVPVKFYYRGQLAERSVTLDPALSSVASGQPTLAAVQPRVANSVSSTTVTHSTAGDHTTQQVVRLEHRVEELERRIREYDQRFGQQR